MDFFRPRAIPALAAALIALPAAAANCASLEGTYRFTAAKAVAPGEPPETLADFTTGKERSKLYRVESKGSTISSWNATGLIRHPKTAELATRATLKRAPTKTTLQFMGDDGKTLVVLGIDELGHWACKGEYLERRAERTAGLADSIRTERVEEVLEKNAAGDLVHKTTVTTLDPKGIKPVIREAVFPAAH